ncbi:two-component system sensor histidine kinase NtrB [Robertmurraya korlensis]|uniref:two-component system sensor histidine kinase NtrB n=1 Tax=Robertmurraya korlensis TaxID=519977 RepID=UPI0008244BC6|nr:ATP-binding protein [Robertmurraya korlensis]
MENNQKMKEMEEELSFYKRLVSTLPFSFTYSDPEFDRKLCKNDNGQVYVKRSTPNRREFKITSANRIPFEEIEVLLNEILDVVPHHIVFINSKGIVTLCNEQAAIDLHVDRESVIGKHLRELLQIPDKQIKMLETLQTGKPIVNQEILDKNYGIINTRLIKNSEGKIERVVGVFRFLNHIKEAEKQTLASRIAAGIAHEIRNPLTTVRGYLQLLEGRVEKETAEVFLSLLIPEIDRANKIITDFLRISKPGVERREVLEVKDFFIDYLGHFLNSDALLNNVNITFNISDDSANCFFIGDREELFQVFSNLYQNSMQAKKSSLMEITISTELIGSNIFIQFIDNGIGIAPNLIQHVFDPFFTTKDEGTGLGLSVSKKIIENYHGTMNVKSSPLGTHFLIYLPVHKGEIPL